jgi:NitT/TauT family transport system ATP-binding protein
VFFITHDISEAVALGDYIGVMGKDSASGLKRIIANDLPRPRLRGDERFGALYAQVEEALAS